MRKMMREGDRINRDLQQQMLLPEISKICKEGIAGLDDFDVPILRHLYLRGAPAKYRPALFEFIQDNVALAKDEDDVAFQALVGRLDEGTTKAQSRKSKAVIAINALREGTPKEKMTLWALEKHRMSIVHQVAEQLANSPIGRQIEAGWPEAGEEGLPPALLALIRETRKTIAQRVRSNFRYRVELDLDAGRARVTNRSQRHIGASRSFDVYICRTDEVMRRIAGERSFLGIEIAGLELAAWRQRIDDIQAALFIDGAKREGVDREVNDDYVRISFNPLPATDFGDTAIVYNYPIAGDDGRFRIWFGSYFTCGPTEIAFIILSRRPIALQCHDFLSFVEEGPPAMEVQELTDAGMCESSIYIRLGPGAVIMPRSNIELLWWLRTNA